MKFQLALPLALGLCLGLNILSEKALADLQFDYKQLILKDLEQMGEYVERQLKIYETDGTSITPLSDSVQYLFSRPDDDGVIGKLLPTVQQNLEERNEWNKVLVYLTNECLEVLKNDEKHSASKQITALIILENIISETKPEVRRGDFAKDLLKKIEDADIDISKKAKNERKLRAMKAFVSPSKLAERVREEMEELIAKEKAAEKAKEEAAKKKKQ